ncbi:MAG: amidohydrolase family protein [Firmicutes bacterium]|nr:amidohydrolase family protein [Bacillota bacterium]
MPLFNDIAAMPLIDQHCHALHDETGADDLSDLAHAATQAQGTYPLADMMETVAFQTFSQNFRQTGITSSSGSPTWPSYCRHLLQQAGYRALIMDVGFHQDHGWNALEMEQILQMPVYRLMRLETQMELIQKQSADFDEWRDRLIDMVRHARDLGYVGAKSIAAYRTGLQLHAVSEADARIAYADWRESGKMRLTSPELVAYGLWMAAPFLAKEGLPLQFHTGYGDADEDLRLANPLLLRGFLERFVPQGLTVILLHTYPYHREAGYLASIYERVYFDVSLAVPLALPGSSQIIAESLELAPLSRFLFASAAHSRPEIFFWAAQLFRKGFADFLQPLLASSFIQTSKALDWAEKVLWKNGEVLYQLPPQNRREASLPL